MVEGNEWGSYSKRMQDKREEKGGHRLAPRAEKTDDGVATKLKGYKVWDIYQFEGCAR